MNYTNMLYTTFYDILNDLMARSNLDIYVTGSNSKMLSTDIVTNFRDRGTEIKVYPLSFKEYYAFSGLEKADAGLDSAGDQQRGDCPDRPAEGIRCSGCLVVPGADRRCRRSDQLRDSRPAAVSRRKKDSAAADQIR